MVSAVRRATGERRVGHAGTLDPFATGLLVVGIGPATRLSNFAMDDFKTYSARISFGCSTSTDDLSGEIAADAPDSIDPGDATLADLTDPGFAQDVLNGFLGEQMQLPPAYCAKKVAGKKAYELAREGAFAELERSAIVVRSAKLLACGRGDDGTWSAENVRGGLDTGFSDARMATLPWWDVEFSVSKGTYIRALARDIGQHVGCGAFLSKLRRTALGCICVADAVPFDDLGELGDAEFLRSACLDPCKVLGLPVCACLSDDIVRIGNGAPITVRLESIDFSYCAGGGGTAPAAAQSICMVHGQKLHAIYTADIGQLAAYPSGAVQYACKLMIPGGVIGVERP